MKNDAVGFAMILFCILIILAPLVYADAYGKQKRIECIALVASKPAIEIQAICK